MQRNLGSLIKRRSVQYSKMIHIYISADLLKIYLLKYENLDKIFFIMIKKESRTFFSRIVIQQQSFQIFLKSNKMVSSYQFFQNKKSIILPQFRRLFYYNFRRRHIWWNICTEDLYLCHRWSSKPAKINKLFHIFAVLSIRINIH